MPGARAEVLESFTETRVEPGEGVGGDLEEEGHPGPGKMHEPKFRGTKGRLGPGMVPVWVDGGQEMMSAGRGRWRGWKWGRQIRGVNMNSRTLLWSLLHFLFLRTAASPEGKSSMRKS